ncbi:hypothetical protein UG55_10924 [Frankia sp. EI5c]|uniref:hypothetical protein n=1 Tax=Frankia sp. EI5c TaxID=683316 RepID=UPI0007C21E47|nr:hypothetical protein [Frankia sp. EI5c]OAA19311.1 hypothetical protein UG55_10924 [Frankia sp. EI5c]
MSDAELWSRVAAAFRPSPYGERLWGSAAEGAFIRGDEQGGSVLTVRTPGEDVAYHVVGVSPDALR